MWNQLQMTSVALFFVGIISVTTPIKASDPAENRGLLATVSRLIVEAIQYYDPTLKMEDIKWNSNIKQLINRVCPTPTACKSDNFCCDLAIRTNTVLQTEFSLEYDMEFSDGEWEDAKLVADIAQIVLTN